MTISDEKLYLKQLITRRAPRSLGKGILVQTLPSWKIPLWCDVISLSLLLSNRPQFFSLSLRTMVWSLT